MNAAEAIQNFVTESRTEPQNRRLTMIEPNSSER